MMIIIIIISSIVASFLQKDFTSRNFSSAADKLPSILKKLPPKNPQ